MGDEGDEFDEGDELDEGGDEDEMDEMDEDDENADESESLLHLYNNVTHIIQKQPYSEVYDRANLTMETIKGIEDQFKKMVDVDSNILDTLRLFLQIDGSPIKKDGIFSAIRTQRLSFENLNGLIVPIVIKLKFFLILR